MSETIKWSFSSDRSFRRCQRQYFLTQIAAHHSAKDSVRREAFLNNQLKTLELWQGTLIHRGIERFVVPSWKSKQDVDWTLAIQQTQELAKRQLAFSAAHRFREEGMTKTMAGDDYCALVDDESEAGVSNDDFKRVLNVIEQCFTNLSQMNGLLRQIESQHGAVWCEFPMYLGYDSARLEVHLDLMFFRDAGKPTIIDWKVSESMGGSDADLQTGLYAWAMCEHYEWNVKEPEDCELIEVQLLTNCVVHHRFDSEAFSRIENRIYRSISTLNALRQGRKYNIGDIVDYEFAENPNNCALCSQRALCTRIMTDQSGENFGLIAEKPKRKQKEKYNAPAQAKLF